MTLLAQHALLDLSAEDRLELISELWDSLEADDLPLSSALCEELDRRIARIDSGEDQCIPWETVQAELAARSRRP